MRQRLSAHPVPLQFPIGREDLFHRRNRFHRRKSAIIWKRRNAGRGIRNAAAGKTVGRGVFEDASGRWKRVKASALTPEFYKEHREKVVEYIAEHDDAMLTKYLEQHKLSLRNCALRCAVDDCVEIGSGAGRLGVQEQGHSAAARCGGGLSAGAVDVPPVEGTDPNGRSRFCAALRTISRLRRWRSRS
jgi:hypothetical protein